MKLTGGTFRKFTWVTLAGGVSLLSACRQTSTNVSEEVDAAQWGTYNKTYNGQRFSPLNLINTSNIGALKPLCSAQLGDAGQVQSGPIVVNNVLYVTTATTTVALDATSCDIHWQNVYQYVQPPVFSVNRGVAFSKGVLYRGTPDGRLLAINAADGKTVWTVKAADPLVGEFISSAPLVWNDMLYAGVAGSDWGIRGHMMAFDVKTGKELWRFNTIPMGTEPGAETWKTADSAKLGGGGTWTTYTLDTSTGELFVPVANPAPDYRPDLRPGDNLYTNSIVVLDARTGALRWYYQARPNDGLDLDLAAAPALYVLKDGRSVFAAGSKDGHVYVVDRATHQLVFKTQITTISNPTNAAMPTREGMRLCPGYVGGVEWNGPAVDVANRTLFVGAVDWCMIFQSGDAVYSPGGFYYGTRVVFSAKETGTGWITAIDADTGAVRWQHPTKAPVVSGVTPTAGGVVFGGDGDGNFFALESKTGQEIYNHDIGGSMGGGIVTYEAAGKQYVAAISGNISRSGLGVRGSPTLTILGVADVPAEPKITKVAVDPLRAELAKLDSPGRGELLYARFCSTCHAENGSGGIGPDIRKFKDPAIVAAFVKSPAPPMPKLNPAVLSDSDVTDISGFVSRMGSPKKPSQSRK